MGSEEGRGEGGDKTIITVTPSEETQNFIKPERGDTKFQENK
jgi:hypothetical protein